MSFTRYTLAMNSIDRGKRFRLSELLLLRRLELGWSQEELATAGENSLRNLAASESEGSESERAFWQDIEVTRHHVAAFEGLPCSPLGKPSRRARLLGIVMALGVDRAEVNSLAGGI